MHAARRLPRISRSLTRACRPLSTAPHNAPSIGALLSAASAASPLKDAVKFVSAPKSAIWTYRELESHVNALAAGLSELGYASHTLLTLLPPGSPEYAVLLLAASKLGASIATCPPPSDPAAVDLAPVRAALEHHRPRAFFIGAEYLPAPGPDDDAILASVNPILHALAPDVALRDARGPDGFVPLTGRPFHAPQFPYLQHVVHTSDINVRGAITFKSLLVYSGASPARATADAPLLLNDGVSERNVIANAKKLAKRLNLSADHRAKEGKLVVTPTFADSTASAVVAALMHEALWVNPGEQDPAQVSAAENALSL